ncbi:MAG: hypothetical protein BWY74_02134 [Firmicutes bacterium ADurb.Bin419]|jgi:histidinol dehydrogenase|nr:MAG: hypothetical protein BWY74_02134 [Firmicutes bacterium ADurb.Bin419]
MNFTQNDNDRLLEKVAEGEKALLEYTRELREKLDANEVTFNDIENMMLRVMQTMRHCTVAIAEGALSEKGLKKTKSKHTKNVEER